MKLETGNRIEVVLDNPIERDALTGTFVGWKEMEGINYLVIRLDSVVSFIAQRIIRTIHILDEFSREGSHG